MNIVFFDTIDFCPEPDWIGDGQCDDATNTVSCSYDGGDCCLENKITDNCEICECIDPFVQCPLSHLLSMDRTIHPCGKQLNII